MRIYFGQLEESLEDPPLVRGRDWRAKACSKHAVSRDLSVCGTYAHGLFDLDAVACLVDLPLDPVRGDR